MLDRAFEHPLELEEHASTPLAGGIMQHGYQCGVVWGAALAAGAQAFRLHGPGPKAEAEAVIATQRLVGSFVDDNRSIDCLEITGTDWKKPTHWIKNFITGGPVRCVRLTSRFAPVAFRDINTALSETHAEAPPPPVSCAAMLAAKMGLSDQQTVMASGCAGGIGLSGSGCGALGVAIWFIGMDIINEGGKLGFKIPRASAVVERFLKNTDQRFRCSDIVGRKFDDVDDHAAFLRDGGCSELIEELATAVSEE